MTRYPARVAPWRHDDLPAAMPLRSVRLGVVRLQRNRFQLVSHPPLHLRFLWEFALALQPPDRRARQRRHLLDFLHAQKLHRHPNDKRFLAELERQCNGVRLVHQMVLPARAACAARASRAARAAHVNDKVAGPELCGDVSLCAGTTPDTDADRKRVQRCARLFLLVAIVAAFLYGFWRLPDLPYNSIACKCLKIKYLATAGRRSSVGRAADS